MQEDNIPMTVSITYRLEKYDDSWSQEDIEAGRAIPYEVLEGSD